jgi:very-short-patch-repair endonuclease
VKFQKQAVLAPYIADFASRSERLVIELDGDTHGGREVYDAARTRVLEERGYRVIRFTNAEVMTNMDGVLRAILTALGRDPQSARPLQGERDRREAPGRGGRSRQHSPLSLRR